MQNSIFVVNEEPYCLWEKDLQDRNNEFLSGIDTDYFGYALNIQLEAEDEKRAAIAIRVTFHHAMETMFSLLGAYVQAPDCAYAWISKCSNRELGLLIKRVDAFDNNIFTKLNIEKVSWEYIAKSIFQSYMPNTELNTQTVEAFTLLWKRLVIEFSNQNCIDEYNSIKHGFRIRSGGFSLSAGIEGEHGVLASPENMTLTGNSSFGSTMFNIESIGEGKGNRSIRSRRTSINWSIERTILLLQLISMSITNITSALKIVNGSNAGSCKFVRPENNTDFEKPWEYSTGVTCCNMDYVIPKENIVSISKSELLKRINNGKI